MDGHHGEDEFLFSRATNGESGLSGGDGGPGGIGGNGARGGQIQIIVSEQDMDLFYLIGSINVAGGLDGKGG